MDLPVLILAAGQSSRMRGVDKLLELVDRIPVLTRQIKAASQASNLVYVALSDDDGPRADLVCATRAQPIVVPDAADGVGVTLRKAIAQLPPCPAFMIVLADLVELQAADYQSVVDAYHAHPKHLIWRATTHSGKPGHPFICDASLRPAFAALAGDTGGGAFLRAHAKQTYHVALPDDRALCDLDTPEDWAAWRARTGR